MDRFLSLCFLFDFSHLLRFTAPLPPIWNHLNLKAPHNTQGTQQRNLSRSDASPLLLFFTITRIPLYVNFRSLAEVLCLSKCSRAVDQAKFVLYCPLALLIDTRVQHVCDCRPLAVRNTHDTQCDLKKDFFKKMIIQTLPLNSSMLAFSLSQLVGQFLF